MGNFQTKGIQNQLSDVKYDLKEIDWICVSDYMDPFHSRTLIWLCSSSHALCWAIANQLDGKVPWVRLLHGLHNDIQIIILNSLTSGIQATIIHVNNVVIT